MAETTPMTPADILKDIAKLDKALSAACYYDSMSGASADKKY